jgi:hypothetical protein|eukprot:CAMPEP_0177774446 /NCGR_PEP_ID=MMETSP0491_2-20121128/13505_1 /TAXON_ID=63592 /ORGANISM="Tetraselmis chuii, Strain PLY429" /LENGTH=54 /DNA_ID=CAMNT_0019292813 /DNA_START=776 /DNA_END=940 /DNA_ORIENTATION=-
MINRTNRVGEKQKEGEYSALKVPRDDATEDPRDAQQAAGPAHSQQMGQLLSVEA